MKLGEKYKNGRYTVLRKLGWGHFSTVWLVRDSETGGEAALKVCVCTILFHLPPCLQSLLLPIPICTVGSMHQLHCLAVM